MLRNIHLIIELRVRRRESFAIALDLWVVLQGEFIVDGAGLALYGTFRRG